MDSTGYNLQLHGSTDIAVTRSKAGFIVDTLPDLATGTRIWTDQIIDAIGNQVHWEFNDLDHYWPGRDIYVAAFVYTPKIGESRSGILNAGTTRVNIIGQELSLVTDSATFLVGMEYGSASPSELRLQIFHDDSATVVVDTLITSGITENHEIKIGGLESGSYWSLISTTNSAGTTYGDTTNFTVASIALASVTHITQFGAQIHAHVDYGNNEFAQWATRIFYTDDPTQPLGTSIEGGWPNETEFLGAPGFSIPSSNDSAHFVLGERIPALQNNLKLLDPNTTYYVIGEIRDGNNYFRSDTLTFTTTPRIDAHEGVRNADGISALIAADYSPSADAVTGRGFHYSTDAGFDSYVELAVPLDGDTVMELTISGLQPDSVYYYRAYVDFSSERNFSETEQFLSRSCEPVTYQGHTYEVTLIRDICIFAENLQAADYRDGSPIPGVSTYDEWQDTDGPKQMFAPRGNEYGRLYNEAAVDSSAGICPQGWGLPSELELYELPNAFKLLPTLSNSPLSGLKLKSSASDSPAWDGTNTSYFYGVEAGALGYMSYDTTTARYWTEGSEIYLTLVAGGEYATSSSGSGDKSGHSVRCIANDVSSPFVSGYQPTSVTSESATLHGSIDHNGFKEITHSGFLLALDPDMVSAEEYPVVPTDGVLELAISNLDTYGDQASLYYVVYATNSMGTTYSDVIGFTLSHCTPVDYAGTTYETIEVNGTCWFAENLVTSTYANGEGIVEVQDNSQWTAAPNGAWCYYENDAIDPDYFFPYSAYGKLYNWHAVNDSRGLCPTGWHVSTDQEWLDLTDELGGDGVAGGKLKLDSPWNGTDEIGFGAIPGGERSNSGSFASGGFNSGNAYFWTSTSNESNAWLRVIGGNSNGIGRYGDGHPNKGFSVRCVQAQLPGIVVNGGSLTATGLELMATISEGDGANTDAGFEWGQTPALTDAQVISSAQFVGDITVNLGHQTVGDTVYFRAFASNASGTKYSVLQSFVFTDCAPSYYQSYRYETVAIGGQCWFAENLRSTEYRNGDPIPTGSDIVGGWSSTSDGACTVYDEGSANESQNLSDYGRLYNWYAVTDDERGLCPSGWHVPTQGEYTELKHFLGGSFIAGGAMKASSTDSPGWDGTNSSGFSALPGGFRGSDGVFNGVGSYAYFWSSSPSDSLAWNRFLFSNFDDTYQGNSYRRSGYAVRCLRNQLEAPTGVTSTAGSLQADTSITLSGEAISEWTPLTAVGFKWGYEPDLSDGTLVSGDTLNGTFHADLGGLVVSDSLYFVAYATNALGTTFGDTSVVHLYFNPCESETSLNYQGHDYDLVGIGSQCWFAENLRSLEYRNDDPIPTGSDIVGGWGGTSDGACAVYDEGGANESQNLSDYGRLYNWYAVTDARGLCPSGWHVPTDGEYTELLDFLGGATVAGDQMKSASADSPSWDGTNSSGFSALPGGNKTANDGFDNKGVLAYFWTYSSSGGASALYWLLESDYDDVLQYATDRHRGLSVRCVQD